MARAKRTSTAGGRSRRGMSAWLLVAIGIGLGAGIMWGAEHYFGKGGKPWSGIASLFKGDSKSAAAKKPSQKKPASKTALEDDKPKLDFYSVLPGDTTAPKSAGAGPFVLQAGSFSEFRDADRQKARLALMGLEARIEAVSADEGGARYRVRLGPYHTKKDLDAARAKLDKKGIEATLIKINPAGA
jgi:cell division protein FtsN